MKGPQPIFLRAAWYHRAAASELGFTPGPGGETEAWVGPPGGKQCEFAWVVKPGTSQFWRPKSKIKSGWGWFLCSGSPWPGDLAPPNPQVARCLSSLSLCPYFSFPGGHQSHWISHIGFPNGLTCLVTSKIPCPNGSHRGVLGVRTSTYTFWGGSQSVWRGCWPGWALEESELQQPQRSPAGWP